LSIFLIVLVDILGFTIILPLLPFYAENLGATPWVVGWLLSSYGLCQLVAGPVLGQISDRVGRRPVLLVSQIGTFVGFLILAFSKSLVPVFISRVIDGLTAGNISVAQAYISDVTEQKNRAKAFGLIGIAFGFGFLVGPALAGFLAHFGHQCPIFAAAGLSLTSALATYILLPASQIHASDSPSQKWEWKIYFRFFKDAALGPLLGQFFSFVFAFVLFFSGFALFAERRFIHHEIPFGTKEVSSIFAYVGLLGIIIQGALIGRLVKRWGEAWLVKIGFLCMGIGFLYLGGSFTVPHLLAAVTIGFVGMSVLRPSLTSLITQKIGRAQQGTVLGLTQSLMSISQVVAPLVSGVLIQHQSLTLWTWIGALSSGSGLLFLRFDSSRGNLSKVL